MKEQCKVCKAELISYWLKDGICNGCRNPDSIVVAETICKRCKEEETDGWTYCEACQEEINEGISQDDLINLFESQGE